MLFILFSAYLFVPLSRYYSRFDTAKIIKMTEILLLSVLIIAISMALLSVKLIFRRNGEFTSQHIHDSKAMHDRGIHCVMDQDREMRRKSRFAVDEKSS